MNKTMLFSCLASLAFSASAVTAPTSEELAKMNLQIDNDVQSAFVHCNEVTLEYLNNETSHITINNFLSNGNVVNATVDWATGDIKIAPQKCGEDYDNGVFYMLVSADAKSKSYDELPSTFITGKTDGKTITLDAWNLMIVSYRGNSNTGAFYPEDLTTKFLATNATMACGRMDWNDSWTDLVFTEELTLPVYGEIDGQELTVYNWGGEPAKVTLQREASNAGFWFVPEDQVVMTRKKYSYGIYPMITNGEDAGSPAEGPLKSKEQTEPNKLRFGTWVIYDKAKQRDRGYNEYANITFDFDIPIATGVTHNVATKSISGVKYVNLAGVQSTVPFDGVNVVVTTYSDGTKSISKIMK